MWCLNIFVYFLYCFLGLSFWPAFIVLEYSIPWSIFSYNHLVRYFTLIIFCRVYWYEITFSDVLEGRRREQDFFFLMASEQSPLLFLWRVKKYGLRLNGIFFPGFTLPHSPHPISASSLFFVSVFPVLLYLESNLSSFSSFGGFVIEVLEETIGNYFWGFTGPGPGQPFSCPQTPAVTLYMYSFCPFLPLLSNWLVSICSDFSHVLSPV